LSRIGMNSMYAAHYDMHAYHQLTVNSDFCNNSTLA